MSYIHKKSVGRTSSLGDHFDIRSDQFLTTNIFKERINDKIDPPVDDQEINFEFSTSSSIQEKFSKLDIDGNLKLSILFGLIDVGGQGSYLKEDNSEKKVVRGSLIYKVKTKMESFKINFVKSYIDIESLNNEHATHVVDQIIYGANVIITFEKSYSTEENKKEISGSLSAAMKKLGGCFSVEGKVDLGHIKKERELLDEFNIKFVGDIIPTNEEIPNSVESALNILKNIPIYLKNSNNGKGKPIEYGLIPIEQIQKLLSKESNLNRVYELISDSTINSIETEIEQLAIYKLELNEFNKELDQYKNYFNFGQLETVTNFINQVKVEEKTFNKSISEIIVAVRSGTKEMSKLDECIAVYAKSKFSSSGIRGFLDEDHQINLKNQLYFIKDIKSMGIEIVSNTMNKDQILKLSNDGCRLYILNYYNSTRSNSEHWSSIYVSTFMNKYNEKRSNEKFAIIDLEIHNHYPYSNKKSSKSINDKVPFIEKYINQKLTLSNFIIDPTTNFVELVKEDSHFDFTRKVPAYIPLLRSICPCKAIKKVPKEWKCINCNDDLKYQIISKTCYCTCGSYPIINCGFKCSEAEHGNEYFPLPDDVNEQLKYLPTDWLSSIFPKMI